MTMVTWARHGENRANVTRTLSFRVYDESLTGRGCQQARDLAAGASAGRPGSGLVGQVGMQDRDRSRRYEVARYSLSRKAFTSGPAYWAP